MTLVTSILGGTCSATWRGSWDPSGRVKKYGLTKCLELYEKKIRNSTELMAELRELEGMELGCWCKPAPCHGDVLIKIFKESMTCMLSVVNM